MKKIIFILVLVIMITGCFSSGYKIIFETSKDDWDTAFRETGNIIYHENTYYMYYSGHIGENENGLQDIYIGVATSKDGIYWERHGKALDYPSEDAYVMVDNNGVFYMVFEDKTIFPDYYMSMASSTDGIHFELTKTKLIDREPTGYMSDTIGSPCLFKDNGQNILIYEGQGVVDGEYVNAKLGIANNTNIFNDWSYDTENWLNMPDKAVVCDDIIKIDDTYYMSGHYLVYMWYFTHWKQGIYKSNNLYDWERIDQYRGLLDIHFIEKDYGYDLYGIENQHKGDDFEGIKLIKERYLLK